MKKSPTLSAETKRTLYYNILLQRRAEERIAEAYPQREMRCPVHFCIGHEAIAAGVCAALRPTDIIYPYYRSHGWYLAKGGDLKAMMAELMGRETGCAKGWGGSMHLIDLKAGVMGVSAIVSGLIPHAAGAALAAVYKKTDSVVAISFGDAAAEEGVYHETMNFSALYKLPVIFVCENNLYATNTHIRDRQAVPGIARHATRFEIPGVEIDGNDVAAVYGEALKAVERARSGGGPSVIEGLTYRKLEHCGPNEDHALGYRTKQEIDEWWKREPLGRAASFVTTQEASEMRAKIDREIDEALAFARSSPFPQTTLF